MKKHFYVGIVCLITLTPTYTFAQTNTFPSSGNAGIGTTSPQTLLHISGATPAFRIQDTNGNNSSFYGDYLDYAQLSVNRNPSTGVFVNTSKAAAQLSIYGGSGDAHFEFYTSNANNNTPTEKMRLSASGGLSIGNSYVTTDAGAGNIICTGNIGIGTTGPAEKLEVNGNIKTTGFILTTGAASGKVLTSDGSGNATWQTVATSAWGLNGSTVGAIKTIGTVDNYDLPLITNNTERMRILAGGSIVIGTTSLPSSDAKLAVSGNIYSKKVKVTQSGWADYVFYPGYRLRPLSELEQYIQQQQHLPDVPSAADVEKDGIDLGDNQAALLKKIEELTLYVIAQNKKLQSLEKQVQQLQKRK